MSASRAILWVAVFGIALALLSRNAGVKAPPAEGIVQASAKTFEASLNARDWVLVDFYADWCGPCRKLQGELNTLVEWQPEVFSIVQVDTDALPEIGRDYQVEALPTLVLHHKGKPVARARGFMPAAELQQWITTQMAQTLEETS